ncbi:MFS transporter [Haliea sp. E17]|uniref:MFS transporter n=1 Tax=Haliea sp. E17 TaxID=3401576 RepID=UPI003AAD1460
MNWQDGETADAVLRRAFTCQLWALSLTKLGDALVSSRLVLAWMLTAIGSPPVLVALLVPLRESLALLPQLFVAAWLRARPVRKWFWVAGSVGQALALAAMALALLVLPGVQAGVLVVALLAVFSLSRGVCSVVAKDVLGKTVPRRQRGRLTGYAASFAGLATLAAAALLWWLPQAQADARVFAALIAFAALLWVAAASIYAAVPEAASVTGDGGRRIGDALRALSLVYTDRPFRHFLVARMLLVATAFSIPYLVVLIQRSGAGGMGALAALMLAEGAAGLVSGAFWGRWSDRAAHLVMAAAAALGALVIAICLWLGGEQGAPLGMPPVAACMLFSAAIAHHGARIGRTTYLVDMASDSTRLDYTAVSNTVMGVFLLAGAGLGLLDALWGTAAVLWFLLMVALLAALYCARLPAVE